MNRRNFIKTAGVSALTTWTVTCQYEEKDQEGSPNEKKDESGASDWRYRVYCYERQQGEWVFSQNTRGSFNYQREYMTFDEEDDLTWNGYNGWMDQGKLHFQSLDDSMNFVECHVRVKEDINLKDSIYDIYKINDEGTEIKVAHYWFNGDTGRQIHWADDSHISDLTRIECG